MPRKAGTTTVTIQNITDEQKKIIDTIIQTTGESKNALFKRLIAEEAQRLSIPWPDDSVRTWSPKEPNL